MKEFVKITFLGDIMCSIPESARAKTGENKYDYRPAFRHISGSLKNSDFVVGNLETPIAGHDLNYTSETTLFNSPIEFVEAIKSAGVDMVTTANNHALDRGLLGLKRTIANLKSVPIEFTGIRESNDESPFLIKQFEGFRIAFLSYTYGTDAKWRNNALLEEEAFHLNYFKEQETFPLNTHTSKIKEALKLIVPEIIKRMGRDSTYPDCGMTKDLNSHCLEEMLSTVRMAKQQADYVMMCIHIGGQYNDDVGAYTKSIIERCVEAGCDTVIGNHPHCVQRSSLLSNGFLAYALGNFYCTPHWGYYVDGVWADYSIVLTLHLDIKKRGLKKVTFAVAKSVIEDGHSVVKLVNDLFETATEKEKKRLQKDNAAVINRFLGRKKKSTILIKNEYDYSDFVRDK